MSQPGLLRPGGFGHLAFVALFPWAWAASRPGRRAFLVEWIVGGIGLAAWVFWLRHVFAPVLPAIALVTGLYPAFAGVALRRLVRRFPLAFAAPAAWMLGEMPRWLLEAPFSFGWWRLGAMAHDTPWLAGSARVWGTWGLSWVFAAFAGMLADLWLRRGPPVDRPPPRAALLLGCGPLVLGVVFSLATAPPPLAPRDTWPRVLLVQPGIEQERKMRPEEPLRDLYGNACALTHEGLEKLRAAGEPPPDLVAWGETMLWISTAGEGFAAAVEGGAQPLPWTGMSLTPAQAHNIESGEEAFVQGLIFGRESAIEAVHPSALRVLAAPWLEHVLGGEPLVPRGTSFFAGTEHFVVQEGAVRRSNVGLLWDADGSRQGPAGKLHLVPGAEDVVGTQRFDFFLDAIRAAGGYVPDLLEADRIEVLELRTRSGRSFRMAVSICYDNAFDDPYTGPLRREPVDFHLVASNEAWYREDGEMEHMMAFSRLIAIATGRSVVRATNSGISSVIDPQGREHATLEVDGKRKMVRGTLLSDVPVPLRSERRSEKPGGDGWAPRTFFVRWEPFQLGAWGALILLSLFLSRRPRRAS
jgi:apolipoprotein N-acyltransferase